VVACVIEVFLCGHRKALWEGGIVLFEFSFSRSVLCNLHQKESFSPGMPQNNNETAAGQAEQLVGFKETKRWCRSQVEAKLWTYK